MSKDLGIAAEVVQYLTDSKIEEKINLLENSSRSLIGIFLDLNYISQDWAQDSAYMVSSCRDRANDLMRRAELIETDQRVEDLLSLNDQLMIVFLILFRVYDRFHEKILVPILREYLPRHNLISKDFIRHVFAGRSPILDEYDFTIAVRLMIGCSATMQAIFGKSADTRPDEAKNEAVRFGDSLIQSMVVRNEIAHMSEEPGYYRSDRIEQSLRSLAQLLPLVLETLRRLLVFFCELHNEAPLSRKGRGGREGLLKVLIDRFKDSNDQNVKKVLSSALRKIKTNPQMSNEDLVRTES